jgi:anti-sigma factor RsiW
MDHMDCDDARAYARGEMNAAAQSRWTAHLGDCSQCRDFVAQERALAGLLKLADDSSQFDGAVDRVLARIEPAGRRTGEWQARWLGVSIGLAVLLGIALGLGFRNSQTPTPAVHPAPPKISDPTQRAAIANLKLLQTIEKDPWLVDDYKAAQWLSKLLVGYEGG